ncbi:MAG TPA: ABC transporter permease [Vicinamibacterales bacterium]|nr:ABC transporter permease [Vicinamibacterales bacterium]
MEKLLHDLRYAVRSLFRQPSFALTAIGTLALGIGATTAIFSVVNGVILRPLPFERADRIVSVQTFWQETGRPAPRVSAPDFHDWKAASRSFEAFAYYAGGEGSATVNGRADYVTAFRVTPGFFETLRARPALGRLLSEDEHRPGGPLAAVITDDYWRRQFDGEAEAIGATLKFADRHFTIVGVLGPEVRFPARADVYYPAAADEETTSRSAHNYRVIARLAEGVTLDQARAEMTAIATRLAEAYPDTNRGKLAAVIPLQEVLVGPVEETLWLLFGAVSLVLLIACANVANLLLARSSARTREMVVRAAVGADRWRLVRQLLTESAVLGVTAALLGTWLARLATVGLTSLAPATVPRIGEVQVDLMALGFALAVALLASVVFGLAPALQVSRVHLSEGLRQGGKGSSIGSRTGVARSAFVVAEIALAMVLVTGAGLLARSLAAMTSVDMGFDPERVLVLQTAVPVANLADTPRAAAFYRELLEDIRPLPGLQSVAAVRSLPTRGMSSGGYGIDVGPNFDQQEGPLPEALFNVVSPGYFATLRIPITRGRDFTGADRYGAPRVAIVNEALARTSFPDQDPIGRRIQCGLDRESLEFMTIVGVVGDVRSEAPTTPAQPEIYMPFEQHPGPAASMSIVARVETGNPLAFAETIRARIAQLNPDVPVKAMTMETTLASATETPRFRTFLIVVFAGVALLLAVAGIYGVMTYTVVQRVPELGVRIALGASRGNILGLVLARGATLAAAGLAIGAGLACASGRLLEGMLFGVTSTDPAIFALVTTLVAAAALLACYLPARRAVAVDPMVALRAE